MGPFTFQNFFSQSINVEKVHSVIYLFKMYVFFFLPILKLSSREHMHLVSCVALFVFGTVLFNT